KGSESVTSSPSALLVFVSQQQQQAAGIAAIPPSLNSGSGFSPDFGGVITVYGSPYASGGSQGTCPGVYAGYVNYTLTVAQGWGWAPDTNSTTVFTATDNNRTDTKVQYLGRKGDNSCNQTSVQIPYPAISAVYRFTIFFPSNVPNTNYPITLV